MPKRLDKTNSFLEKIEKENLSEIEAFVRIAHRQNEYKRSKNGVYAAEAWILCRKYSAPIPTWILEAVDAAARTGYLYRTKGTGTGRKGDLARQFTENDRNRVVVEAVQLFEKDSSYSQGQLATELRVDPGEFSRICNDWRSARGPLPWDD